MNYLISTAHAATSSINMPAGFPGLVLDNASAFFDSWQGYVVLIVGTLLGVLVIDLVIGAIKK